MTALFYDAYKDAKFAKIQGELTDSYFQLGFEEAKIYEHEDVYYLAGYFTSFSGLQRNYKPENPIEPCLCQIAIHGKDYEIREKDKDGKWVAVTKKASIFEKLLFEDIKNKKQLWQPEGQALKGSIDFASDIAFARFDIMTARIDEEFKRNLQIMHTSISGSHPEWEAPKKYRSGSNAFSNTISKTPEEKVSFVIGQLNIACKGEANDLMGAVVEFYEKHAYKADETTAFLNFLFASIR
jgi:hypothetical protein